MIPRAKRPRVTVSADVGSGLSIVRIEEVFSIYWRLAVILIAVIAILVYVTSLNGELVLDDVIAIQLNPDVTDPQSILEIFKHDFWGTPFHLDDSHKSYRPLTTLTFLLNFRLHGLETFGYHIVNVVLHAVCSALTCYVARPLLESKFAALLCGLLFAVHPIHTEAVASIVGRSEPLYTLFGLIALLAYYQSCSIQRHCWRWFALSLVSVVLATLAKDQGIMIAGVLAAYDVLYALNIMDWLASAVVKRRFDRAALRRILRKNATAVTRVMICVMLGWLAVFVRYLATGSRFNPGPEFIDNPLAFTDSKMEFFLSALYLHVRYAVLLMFPVYMSADYSYNAIPLVASLFDVRNLATAALYIGLAALVRYAIRVKSKLVMMSLACIVIPMLPATNLLFPVGTVIAERLLYFPSIGICLLLSALCRHALATVRPSQRSLVVAFVAVVVAAAICRTALRSADWQSDEKLFNSALHVCPDSAKVQFNIAQQHLRQARLDDAYQHFARAVEIAPMFARAVWKLGKVQHFRGHTSEAIERIERSIRLEPSLSFAYADLGVLYAELGRDADATAMFEGCIREKSDHPDCYANLAIQHLKQSDHTTALNLISTAVNIMPDVGEYYNIGAAVYALMGNIQTALELYERALRLSDGEVVRANVRRAQESSASGVPFSPEVKLVIRSS